MLQYIRMYFHKPVIPYDVKQTLFNVSNKIPISSTYAREQSRFKGEFWYTVYSHVVVLASSRVELV